MYSETQVKQPASLLMTSQIGTQDTPTSSPQPSDDNPVVLMFKYSIVCAWTS